MTMTTRDLYELAALDVLGLLDEDERSAFERAFKAADPSVQADVRREQLRYSDLDSLLPVVETPPGLRARVLNAVRDAISAVQFEPVARIGPGSARMTRWTSGPMWRAACIGFAAATLVLGGYVAYMHNLNHMMAKDALGSQSTAELSKAFGANFTSGLARFQVVGFAPAAQDYQGKAVAQLYFDPQKKRAYLFCDNLPVTDKEYTLVIRGRSGESDRAVKGFIARTGGIASVETDVLTPADLDRLSIQSPIEPSGKREALLVARGA